LAGSQTIFTVEMYRQLSSASIPRQRDRRDRRRVKARCGVQQWFHFRGSRGALVRSRLWLIVFVRDETRRFYLAESADVHAASCAACRRKPSTVGFPTRFHRRVCAVERRQLRLIERPRTSQSGLTSAPERCCRRTSAPNRKNAIFPTSPACSGSRSAVSSST
jgi:hypothetical protein